MSQIYLNINSNYPSSFTGKERDSETGFSYFGARYYDSDLMTAWLSVDPMADKYPGLSPYAYCAWNPVKLVDPDGEEIVFSGNSKEKLEHCINRIKINSPSLYNRLQNSKNIYRVQFSNKDDDSGGAFGYDYESNVFNIFINENRILPERGGYSDIEVLAHELKHAEQFEDNKLGFRVELGTNNVSTLGLDYKDELEAAIFANKFADFPTPYDILEKNTESKYAGLSKNQISVIDAYNYENNKNTEGVNNAIIINCTYPELRLRNKECLKHNRGSVIIFN